MSELASHKAGGPTSAPEKSGLRRVPVELKVRSDDYGARAIIRVFVPLVGLLGVAPWLILWVSPWICLLVAPLLGAQIYKLTIVMHDCAHNSLFSSRRRNRFFGELCGALVGTDVRSFWQLHWKHHNEYGRAGDPQGSDYLGLQSASRRILLWHLLRPLLGYNLFKLGQFSQLQGPRNEFRSSGGLRRKAVLLVRIGATQIVVALLATGFGQIWWLVFLYPVSAATFGLFFSQTRGFAEHVADPHAPAESFVRTHLTNWFDKIFFYDLNFNYHVEHHLYPSAPSCHLPAIHELIRETDHTGDTLSSSILATVHRRLAAAPL